MYKLVIFDVDGTLVCPKERRQFPVSSADWEWMPGRQERIALLQEQGVRIAVASNQANVLYAFFQDEIVRLNPGWKRKSYASAEEVADRFAAIFAGMSIPIYIAVWDGRIRTLLIPPNSETIASLYTSYAPPLSLVEQAQRLASLLQHRLCELETLAFVSAASQWRKPGPGMILEAKEHCGVQLEDILFVGDRQEDEQAARAAGVAFQWANEFFQ